MPQCSAVVGTGLTDPKSRSKSLRQTRVPLTRSKAVKSPDWSAGGTGPHLPEWPAGTVGTGLGPPLPSASSLVGPPRGTHLLRNGVLIRSAATIGGRSTSSEEGGGGAANKSTSSSSSGASSRGVTYAPTPPDYLPLRNTSGGTGGADGPCGQRAPKLGSVVPEISLMASTPVKMKRHYFQVSGSTVSSSEFLGVLSDRRHSDSYFHQRRTRKRQQMRGMLHPKYSYSPNPRLAHDLRPSNTQMYFCAFSLNGLLCGLQ